MEWVQSIQGILTLSIGGISLGSIIGLIVSLFKNGAKTTQILGLKGDLINASSSLKESNETNKALLEVAQEKEIENERLQLQKIEDSEIQQLTLKILSYLISASSIDAITKVDVLKEINNSKDKIEKAKEEFFENLNLKKEEFLKTAKEKKEELLDKAQEKITKTLSTISEKANETIEKYSKK